MGWARKASCLHLIAVSLGRNREEANLIARLSTTYEGKT
jgi:hypothetical protein